MSDEIVANMIAAAALVMSGAWVVAQIKSTTAVLSANIESLKTTVETLSKSVGRLYDVTNNQLERLIVLEEWRKNQDGDGFKRP